MATVTTDEPLLDVQALCKSFGGLRAVNGLSFTVAPGEIVGLLGPNGSGKTTAMNLISGALRADAGHVKLQGQNLCALRPHRIARIGVARTFQLVRMLGHMRVIDNVLAGMAFRAQPSFGAAALEEAQTLLARVGLGGHAEVPAADLTYIDQKRLELARALALQPVLLLLDEWLAGLNPTELRAGIALIQALRADGITIVLVEHVMDAVRALCDRCVVMNAGSMLAEGPTAQVLERPAVIEAYLGVAHV